MNRIATVVAVLVFFVGCKKAIPPAEVVDDFSLMEQPTLPPSPEAIAEVEAVLKEVTVRFEFDRDLLTQDAMVSLQKLAKVLRKNREVKILIAGNCDERGTEEYNFLLGQRRAEAARHYLWVLGAHERQLGTISYGAELPLDFEQTEAAFAINRRDDVMLKDDGQVVSISGPLQRGMGPTP